MLWAVLRSSALLALAACQDGVELIAPTGMSEEQVAAAAADMYSMGHLVEVSIEVDHQDWEMLRFEGRDLISVFTRSQEDYEYTYVDASVTIDGVRHEHAGVRKKGYWGSLSTVRPSLKIDLDRYNPNAAHFGIEKFTLNNDLADASHTHECMAFATFARAGVPASRCNLAHVVVNGEDLGTYSNVEPIDESMLARHFSDPEGNLYEGQLSDFVRADLERMELKTNEKKNDKSDLLALTEALEADDAQLLERLAPLVDIERFRDFWAMELLIGHWDGYTNNSNNFMAYHDPVSGRFQFLPWGTDSTFENANPSGRIYAQGRLAQRLYALPEQKQLFWARFAELTESAWDSAGLLAHIDQVAVIAPDAPAALLDQKRQYVENRQARWRATFGGTPPKPRQRRSSPCEGLVAEISGTFSTTFSASNTSPEGSGNFDLQLSLDGEAVEGATWVGQVLYEAGALQQIPGIRIWGLLPEKREVALYLYVEPSSFQPGSHPFHGMETYGLLNAGDAGKVGFAARIGSGTITFTEASSVLGAPVSGRFDAQSYQVGCVWRR